MGTVRLSPPSAKMFLYSLPPPFHSDPLLPSLSYTGDSGVVMDIIWGRRGGRGRRGPMFGERHRMALVSARPFPPVDVNLRWGGGGVCYNPARGPKRSPAIKGPPLRSRLRRKARAILPGPPRLSLNISGPPHSRPGTGWGPRCSRTDPTGRREYGGGGGTSLRHLITRPPGRVGTESWRELLNFTAFSCQQERSNLPNIVAF